MKTKVKNNKDSLLIQPFLYALFRLFLNYQKRGKVVSGCREKLYFAPESLLLKLLNQTKNS